MNQIDIAPKLNEVDKEDIREQTAAKYEDKIKELVLKDFRAARNYVKKSKEKIWDDCWKCYNNSRTMQDYKGDANDFIPETFVIVESVKANIAGGKPKYNYVPTSQEQNQDTEVLNSLVDFYWEQNNMAGKNQNWIHDMLLYGNGVLMVSWEGDMPHVTNVPLRDFFVDVKSVHMNKPEEPGYPTFAGHRFLTTVDELKNRKIVDPETGEMKYLYKNLDKIKDVDEDDPTDKEAKEKLMGSTLEDKKGQVEVIVYYTRKKKILLANRSVVIYEGENPYKRESKTEKIVGDIDGVPQQATVKHPEIKSFFPYAILRNYVDASLFYAKGDVEILLPRQERLNDVSNQKTDNLTYTMNNMWQIDPQFQHMVEQIESTPGAVFPIPNGAFKPLEKPSIGTDADNEMYRIKDEMRRISAADEVLQGVSQDRGRITATEVQAQMNNATQRFSTKLTNLEQEGYAQLGRIIFKMIQIFVDQKMAVRILGDEGVNWRDYDPSEYLGDYEPNVQLEATTKAVRAEEGQKYALIHQMFAQSPYIDQYEFAKLYLESMLEMDADKLKKIVKKPEENPAPPMGEINGQNIQNPAGIPAEPLPIQ